jgi:hypothetical protein
MATFQSVVLIVAIVILVILLIMIGFILYYQKYSAPWPPKTPMCPDYWIAVPGTVDSVSNLQNFDDIQFNYNDILDGKFDASGAVCVNVKKLGNSKCASNGSKYLVKDFTGANYEGPKGSCEKYKYATDCGISWDGITYGRKDTPCNSSNNGSGNGSGSVNGGQCYLSSMSFSHLGNSLIGNNN